MWSTKFTEYCTCVVVLSSITHLQTSHVHFNYVTSLFLHSKQPANLSDIDSLITLLLTYPTVSKTKWWRELLFWSSTCKSILLIQPSSAAAECVFSLLANSFKEQL